MGDNEDYSDIDPLMRTAKYSSSHSYIQYSGGNADVSEDEDERHYSSICCECCAGKKGECCFV